MSLKQLLPAFMVAGASLLAQETSSLPAGFKQIIETLIGGDTTFKVDPSAIYQGPIGSSDDKFTDLKGRIEDGPLHGKKFTARCAGDSGSLEMTDDTGLKSTLLIVDGKILITHEPETQTVDIHNIHKGNSSSPKYFEFVGFPPNDKPKPGTAAAPENEPNADPASNAINARVCFLREHEVPAFENGQSEFKTVTDYTDCKPVSAANLIDAETARNNAMSTLMSVCENGPIGFPRKNNPLQDFSEAAQKYTASLKEGFIDTWRNIIGKIPHLKSAKLADKPAP